MNKTQTFSEIEKRQKKLLILLIGILIIWALILIRYFKPGFFSFLFPKIEISSREVQRLKLNLKILENPRLENLEFFPQFAPPSPEEIGNKNPFLTSTIPAIVTPSLTPTSTPTSTPVSTPTSSTPTSSTSS